MDIFSLKEEISPLILSIEDNELAKRFDFLMLTIEYSDMKGMMASKPKIKVVSIADRLYTEKGSVDMVKRHKDLILNIQTDEFWKEADIFEYEKVRVALRDLMNLLEYQERRDLYTNFTDQVIEVKEYKGEFEVNDLKSYRKKVNQYLKEHKDDIAVYKLRNNKPIILDDVDHLEKILWSDLGIKDDYTKEFCEQSLLKLVSKIVGLEPLVAKEVFSEFLSDETLNIDQMEFVKLIVDFIITNGSIERTTLNEQPFNKFGNVLSLFEGKKDTILSVIKNIDELNSRIEIM